MKNLILPKNDIVQYKGIKDGTRVQTLEENICIVLQ